MFRLGQIKTIVVVGMLIVFKNYVGSLIVGNSGLKALYFLSETPTTRIIIQSFDSFEIAFYQAST